jgi:hypothetical protein
LALEALSELEFIEHWHPRYLQQLLYLRLNLHQGKPRPH